MNIHDYIEEMKKIQKDILEFLDKEYNEEEHFQNIIHDIFIHKISANKHDLKTLLYLLSKILNNHYRYPHFFSKIERIIQTYKTEIMNNFNSYDIYKIFYKNPRFLLFLFNDQIIKLDANIESVMPKELFVYLFPKEAEEKKMIEKVPENFEEKQKIGENDDFLCQIIRKDLISEFISYVKQNEFYLQSEIKNSIFETNDFLIKQSQTTLIKYAAFFGSTQIFKYLYKNGVELTPSLWIYAVHSDNPEIFHLLEENEIKPPYKSYKKCIKESIKCHHNDIMNYIQFNLINKDIRSVDDINFTKKYKENTYSYSFHYYNFSYFPQEMNNKIILFYACQYDYYQIVEYFLNATKIDIKEEISSDILNH